MIIYVVDFGTESRMVSNKAIVNAWVFTTRSEAEAKASEYDGDVIELNLTSKKV